MIKLKKEIVPGKDLSQKDLDTINLYRKIRLGRTSIWDHENNNGFEERTFFLVKDVKGELLSFATLKSIKIYIQQKEYEIWGIQAVISVVQGKGYGKELIKFINEFVIKSGITMVGFCEKNNTEFYKKCGCDIFPDGCKYFVYVNNNGERYTDDPGDVFYTNGAEEFMDKVVDNKLEVIHYVPHW